MYYKFDLLSKNYKNTFNKVKCTRIMKNSYRVLLY